jgi:hypothetical protein
MALGWALFVGLNLDLAEFLAGPKVPHLEAQQAIDVDENQRVASIYGERTNQVVEGPTLIPILFVLVSATKRNLEFRPAK